MSTLAAVAAVLALVVAIPLAVAAALLTRQVRSLRASVAALHEEVEAQAGAPPAVPVTLDIGPRRVITIEILNPLELAASQSRAARLLGGLTPTVITRIVYDQASKQIMETLEDEGVAAEVRVRVGD
ncbi:MAG: hypothetical protein QM572_12635 [Nocardioides sp.]|uniref:hypothetical protein n=1 Tax=Nocardioides sp. TaxID=35761 RepID=UPI0039E532AD